MADARAAWRGGREELREALSPCVRSLVSGGETPALEILRDKPGRRCLARARLPDGRHCFLKHYPAGPRDLRRRAQRLLRLSPAAREFSHLRRLYAAGVGVPEPLALYRFASGDEVLVTRWLAGESLARALARPHPQRRALLRRTGELVARLHAAGFCHRDLHAGNVWSTADGPVLIDLPAALPIAPRRLRRRDVGQLDMSLSALLSLTDRVRLRAAALGLARPFGPRARSRLRAAGRAGLARRRAHLASRTRRSLRPGRLYAALRVDGGRGMRLRACDPQALASALATPGGDDALRVVRFGPGDLGAWRSPARRAWLAGHGLRARGVGAPRPAAFLEWRRLAGVRRSAVLLEPTRVASAEALGGRDRWLRAVVELGLALRRDGVDHAALCEMALRIDARGALAPDRLDAIRFRRRLSARACARIDAGVARWLASCDASPAERDEALARYAARTRFLPGPPAGGAGPALTSGRGRS